MRVRHALAVLGTSVALLAARPAAANPADAPFTLRITPTFSPLPLRAWTSLELETCAHQDLDGTLALESASRRRRWDAGPVTVVAGACDVRRVPVVLDEDGIAVVLRDPDGRVLSRKGWSGDTTTSPVVAVLGTELLADARAEAVQVTVVSPTAGSLPDDPLVWSAIGAVVAPAAHVDALDPRTRGALARWVELGGILVRVEHGGRASRVRSGLGRVDVVDRSDPQLHARLAEVFDDVRRRWSGVSRLGILESGVLFQTEHPAWLDVSGHRVPGVWTIGAILLVAVVLLAALPSRVVRRRLGSLSAFVGAPIVGLAAFGAIVGLAFAEKGTEPVFESVAIVEAGSGTRLASLQRLVGLLATDAGTTVVRARPGALLLPLDDPTGVPLGHTLTRVAGRRPMQVELPAALWQTVYLREDSTADLAGGVVLRRGDRLPDLFVENHTPFVLHETVVVAGSEDDRVRLGTLTPGATRTIPWVRAVSRARLPTGWPWVSSAGGGPAGAPVLLARLDPTSIPELPGARAERQDVFLRVVGTP